MHTKIRHLQDRIGKSCQQCGRDPATVKLVAVSKTISAQTVRDAAKCGLSLFGENYIQEARKKIADLEDLDAKWHFIGHLQSNKAKYAVRLFNLIHSVDSIKLAKEINKQAQKNNKIQKILLQVNIAAEASKSGVALEGTEELLEATLEMDHIAVCGLMTMPPFFNAPEKVRPFFRHLCELRNKLQAYLPDPTMFNDLSMGMTGDFEVAIEEGATYIRVGTAIFGERS